MNLGPWTKSPHFSVLSVIKIYQKLLKEACSASLNKQMQTYCHYHGKQSKHNTRTQLMAGDDYVAEFPRDEQSYIFFIPLHLQVILKQVLLFSFSQSPQSYHHMLASTWWNKKVLWVSKKLKEAFEIYASQLQLARFPVWIVDHLTKSLKYLWRLLRKIKSGSWIFTFILTRVLSTLVGTKQALGKCCLC